jgi:hypothetical protein
LVYSTIMRNWKYLLGKWRKMHEFDHPWWRTFSTVPSQDISMVVLRMYIQGQILCVWFMPLLYGLILDLHVFAFSISQYCACCMSQAPGWRNHHEVGVVWLIWSRSLHAFFVLGVGYTRDWFPAYNFVLEHGKGETPQGKTVLSWYPRTLESR